MSLYHTSVHQFTIYTTNAITTNTNTTTNTTYTSTILINNNIDINNNNNNTNTTNNSNTLLHISVTCEDIRSALDVIYTDTDSSLSI